MKPTIESDAENITWEESLVAKQAGKSRSSYLGPGGQNKVWDPILQLFLFSSDTVCNSPMAVRISGRVESLDPSRGGEQQQKGSYRYSKQELPRSQSNVVFDGPRPQLLPK